MTNYQEPTSPSERELLELVKFELGESATSLQTLRSGAWSSAIAVSTASAEYVIRFAATADDFYCDAHASQYRSFHLPIPAVRAIGQLDERFWCISERMPGIHLDDLSADQMRRVLPSVARMLIAMREVDSSATSGYGGWDSSGNGIFVTFADQLLDVGNDVPNERGGGWSTVLDKHPFEQRIFAKGLIQLGELVSFLPANRYLIHEDMLNFNVVVQDNRVSGIFDWGTAMWGDVIYDLAWFRFWNLWYPQWADLDIPGYLERAVGIIGAHPEERMRCCLLHIGLMHIRYNAFIGNLDAMNQVAKATERML